MLEDLQPPKRVFNCKVRTTLNELSDSDKKILEAAIGDVQSWPANTLSNELRARGIILVDTTITKHRQGICSC
jgi:hypothetical protein